MNAVPFEKVKVTLRGTTVGFLLTTDAWATKVAKALLSPHRSSSQRAAVEATIKVLLAGSKAESVVLFVKYDMFTMDPETMVHIHTPGSSNDMQKALAMTAVLESSETGRVALLKRLDREVVADLFPNKRRPPVVDVAEELARRRSMTRRQVAAMLT